MNITKINISSEGKVSLIYKQPAIFAKRKDETEQLDHTTLVSEDAPLPEFEAAFQGLDRHFAGLIVKDADFASTLRINGLTISLDKDGNEAATISASKKVSCTNSPLNLTLPMIPEAHWSPDMRQTITNIRKHAEDYIGGKRAQQSLPLVDHSNSSDDADGEGRMSARAELGTVEPKSNLRTIGSKPGPRKSGKGAKTSAAA